MTMLVATAGVIGFEIPWLVSSRKPGQMIAFGLQWPCSPCKAFSWIAACSMSGRGKVTFLIAGQ